MNEKRFDHWPSGARDTTEFPRIEIGLDIKTREHLEAFCRLDGTEWNDYNALHRVGGYEAADSRARTFRKMYERLGLIYNEKGIMRLSRLGQELGRMEKELVEKKDGILDKIRASAASILSRYQLKNPVDEYDLPDDCDVLPCICIWKAMRELGDKINYEEMNRVILRVMKMADLDGAIDKIKDARKAFNKYEGCSSGELDQILGEQVMTDQPSARIAPWFSFAGWGGLLIEQNVEEGYRHFVKEAIPFIDAAINNPPSFFNTDDKDEWLTYYIGSEVGDYSNPLSPSSGVLTPEWFIENSKPYLYADEKAKSVRSDFLERFSIDKIKQLEGMDLIRTLFLNDENKTSLCYELEFNADMKELFGSISSGTAYKYGLFYSKKHNSWMSGSGRKPQYLMEDEAIELGTQIRDHLIAGAEIIREQESLESVEDYKKLYSVLNEATEGDVNRVWVLKYYTLLYPEVFSPVYSKEAQSTVITALGAEPGENAIVRMGQMSIFRKQCDISGVVFNKTFWNNYQEGAELNEMEDRVVGPIVYETGLRTKYAYNRIVFGAPGTGKSFTLEEDRKELLQDGKIGGYERVTFHPDYTYSQFVGTYKPVTNQVGDIRYEFVPGPFMRIYVEALKNSRFNNPEPFLLIIEEINRARVASVFGDIFQLLDRNSNGVSEYEIQASEDIRNYLSGELGGASSDFKKIVLPNNLFIWATMNSADQGVFPMDTAFKRRWEFEYLGINTNDSFIKGTVELCSDRPETSISWNRLRKAINARLTAPDIKVNEDKLLGPYFISAKAIRTLSDQDNTIADPEGFRRAFKNKVLMYLYEDAAKQHKSKLFSGCDSTKYSSVCEAFDRVGMEIFGENFKEEYYDQQEG